MHTWRQACLCSSLMPPSPVAQKLISGDRTANAVPGQSGLEGLSVRDTYPFQVKLFQVEMDFGAQLAEAKQRMHAPRQSNLGAVADTSASVAQDVIEDNDMGYITPTTQKAAKF